MGSVLILDLDETLLHAVGAGELGYRSADSALWQAACERASKQCVAKWPSLTCTRSTSYFMFIRPHAVEFLRYCRQHFDFIVIFTAGTESHAHHIHKNLFESQAQVSADFVFHRESCGKFADEDTSCSSTNNNNNNNSNINSSSSQTTLVQFQKNLCHLREQVEQKATDEQRAKLDWTDCLYIDDLSTHATNNCGEMLLVPKFDYPCLRSLLPPAAAAKQQAKQTVVKAAAMQEAATDPTLLKLLHFIDCKRLSESGHVWQQVDKRFALFL